MEIVTTAKVGRHKRTKNKKEVLKWVSRLAINSSPAQKSYSLEILIE
jgi:hypothetical protein